MTITYDFQTYNAEIMLRNAASIIHLNLYDCEPEIPMAFGDPTVPLLQNLAFVEVMIDKAEECTGDLDCEFGYECDMGICVESECHGGSIDGLVMPKLCGPGMECFYADPIAEDHGNGTCILLPAE